MVKAVSAVLTYGVADGWLHPTLRNVAKIHDYHHVYRVAEDVLGLVERRTRFVNIPVCLTHTHLVWEVNTAAAHCPDHRGVPRRD